MPKRGNPRWSLELGAAPVPSSPSEFERVATRLKLSSDQYSTSPQLRDWVEKNWRQKFVPEKLLKVWGLYLWPLSED
jgi:hypothetical protein